MSLLKKVWARLKPRPSLSAFDISLFFRQFSTLILAGIPIVQSCDILEKSQENIALRLLIYSIKKEIESGKTVFHSFRRHPNYFDELTCQLIKIGEKTGTLDTMLKKIAYYQEKELAFKRKIKQILFYPFVITLLALTITLIMLIFVIPRFAILFQPLQEQLPLLTRCILLLSATLQSSVGLIFILLFLISLFIFCRKKPQGKKIYLTDFALRMPLTRALMQKIILSRFARNLATAFAAGVPITDALTLTANACGHPSFTAAILKLRSKLAIGLQLHQAMQVIPSFPALMIQMVRIGEESGMLENMLEKLADFFEADIDQMMGKFSQLLEPLIMVILGVLIGGLIIGMYLPIFKLGAAI